MKIFIFYEFIFEEKIHDRFWLLQNYSLSMILYQGKIKNK